MDKRLHRRVVYKGATVTCYSLDDSAHADPYNFATGLVDVSLGGACILSVGRLRPEVRFVLDIFFQQHQGGLKGPAMVRWSREIQYKGRTLFMTGLEFLRKPDFSGRALDAVLGREAPGIETKIRSHRSNRRNAPRIKVGVAEIICVPRGLLSALGMRSNVARSLLDLSATGARFSTERALEPGERVKLRVRLPRIGDILTMEAVVRWCKPERQRFLVGVEFEKISPESKSILGALDRWFTPE